MQKRTDDKEVVDQISVKRFNSENLDIFRLQSSNHGIFSGDTLQEALRNMADSVELSNKGEEVGEMAIANAEEGVSSAVKLTDSSDKGTEDQDEKETVSQP